MIWQDKIEIIIMSTELEEKGKVKCERYFPSLGETMTYGAITITATSVVQCPGYLKSQLSVKKDCMLH
jgi:protein tyrosine phosphatase